MRASLVTSAPPPPPFTPKSLSNLMVWLAGGVELLNSSGALALSGESIATWRDQSGNDNHFVAGTATPTLHKAAVNGIDGAAFNGTSQFMKNTSLGFAANPFTVIWVRNRTVAAPTYQAIIGENTAASHYFTIGAANLAAGYYTGVSGTSNGNSLLAEPVGSFSIGSAVSLGGTDPPNEQGTGIVDALFRVNGVNAPQFSSTNASANGFVNSMTLGSTFSSDFFLGDFMEFIYYKRYLSNYEIYQVEQYLASKYSRSYPARVRHDRTTFAGLVIQGVAIPPGPDSWDASFTDAASVIYVQSKSKYYATWDGSPTTSGTPIGQGWASGPDLGSLVKKTTPVISPGFASWCTGNVGGGVFFKDPVSGNTYLYFGGGSSFSFEAGPHLGVVQVTDFDTPTIVDVAGVNPILSPADPGVGTWENQQIYRPSIIYNPFNSTYYIYYNAKGTGGAGEAMGFVTSSSPTGPFTRYVSNPVFPLDGSRYADPCIIQPDPKVAYWVMLMYRISSLSIYYSTNLTSWTANYNNSLVYERVTQPVGGTFPITNALGRYQIILGADNQWVGICDNGGTSGPSQPAEGYNVYWFTLSHDPYLPFSA